MAGRNDQLDQLDAGRVFEGKYRIVDELGRGAFGKVYLAHQEAMDRQVALKVLQTQLTAQKAAQAKERFLREVRVISSLRHPNTVTIHDFGETDRGTLYMVLEYIEGETLDDILAGQGAQPPGRALHFGMQIARSLAEAHRHGVVHRDLKPANIMVTRLETEGDFVKVLDFGVARLLKPKQKDLTQVGVPDDEHQMLGTPRYMSPEQVRNKEIDGRSDVYCLGLLLYEMLVGQPAVQGDTAMALLTQHINPEPLPMEELRSFPDEVTAIVRKATAKDKAQRYESAERLVRDLRRVASTLGKHAQNDPSASGSDSFAAASMSYEGQVPGGSRGGDASRADRQPGGQAGGTGRGADEFGSADQFSPTRPKSEHAEQMPVPPDDDNAFAPDASAEGRAAGTDASGASREGVSAKRQRETLMVFAGDVFKVTFLTAIGLFSIYVSFLLIGSMFARVDGQFAVGETLRFVISAVLALALPALTAISEVADREKMGVVKRKSTRIARLMVATSVISIATGALVTLVMPKTVIGELRTNPNWFLGGETRSSSIASLNADFSQRFADAIATTTAGIGLYEPGTAAGSRRGESKPDPPAPSSPTPPPSTRPADNASDESDDDGSAEPDDGDEESGSRQPRSALELMKQADDDENGEADEEPTQQQEKKEPDAEESAAGSDSESKSESDSDDEGSYKQW